MTQEGVIDEYDVKRHTSPASQISKNSILIWFATTKSEYEIIHNTGAS